MTKKRRIRKRPPKKAGTFVLQSRISLRAKDSIDQFVKMTNGIGGGRRLTRSYLATIAIREYIVAHGGVWSGE